MKLTKKLKADLARAYQCAMEVSILNMKAPLRYINQYIAEDVNGYGTASDEKVRSREDFRKMAMDARQQSKNAMFKAKIITPYRPKFINETTAQFRDEIVIQIGVKKNRHTIHLWFSTIYRYQHNKWQMILFHGSMPDQASSSADTFHVAEAERKLKEMEKVVEERTIELQTKNSELEIETALEKVRAAAMGMYKPDDLLKVCQVLNKELKDLGFDSLRNAMINIHNDAGKTFINYDYSDVLGKSTNHLTYNIHPLIAKQVKKVRKANDAFSETYFTGKDLIEWKKFRRKIGEKDDPRIAKSKGLYYYFYSIGIGSIGISTFEKINEEKIALLKRFRNVFALAYQRYTDISKAEAQAREAQIEAALERVRARSMAMHKSEELAAVASVLFHQLQELDLPNLRRCLIGIVDEKNKKLQSWHTSLHGDSTHNILEYPIDDHPVIREKIKGWKKQKPFSIELTPAKLKSFISYIVKHGFKYSKGEKPASKLIQNHVPFNHGYLEVATHEPITESDFQLLQRFAKVFEQTYTRFLDLQKAEAQAKEAEIQLALERVRARTMAMHKSEELLDTAVIISNELIRLSIPHFMSGFVLVKESENKQEGWLGVPGLESKQRFYLPLKADAVLKERYESWEKKQPLFFQKVSGKKLKKHLDFVSTYFESDEATENVSHFPEQVIFYCGNFKDGYLHILSEELFTAEQESILSRFAKVFEQTYTRFLDLQKAEAQAREAQIEASMERVRARSMAMQSSSELNEVISVLFRQFDVLGMNPAFAHLSLFKEDGKTVVLRMTDKSGERVMAVSEADIDAYPEWRESYEQWKVTEENFVHTIDYPADVVPYILGLLKDLLDKMPEEHRFTAEDFPNGFVTVQGHCRFGYMGVDIERKPTEEEKSIVARFAREFGRIYQRVLDLEKSEAQAREGHIQLSLERVRARSMAMQTTEELQDVLSVLFQQYDVLGIHPVNVFLTLFEFDKNRFIYRASGKGGARAFGQQTVNFSASPIWMEVIEKFKKEKSGATELIHYPKESLPAIFEIFHEAFTAVPEEYQIRPEDFPDGIYTTHGYNEFGYLGVNHTRPCTEEESDIIARFAKEFGRVYQRFLDLQKAEAQARESEIQLGLERVRARAMAMQDSEELKELIGTLFTELTKLDLVLTRCMIMIFDKATMGCMWWMANSEEPSSPSGYFIKYHEAPAYLAYIKAWKKKHSKWEYILEGNEKTNWDEVLFSQTELSNLPGFVIEGMKTPKRVHLTASFNQFGCLSLASLEPLKEEHTDILQRFANTFNLTYTRFNDLKQAEAQAREAQIEAALERVRARAMAMHTSEELKEVSLELRKQMGLLGQKNLEVCAIHLYEEDENFFESWGAMRPPGMEDEILQGTAKFPKSGIRIVDEMMQLYHSGKKDYVLVNEKEKAVEWFNILKKYSPQAYEALMTTVKDIPIEKLIAYWALSDFSGGSMLMVTHTYPDKDSLNLLKRSSNVFDLAYRRFKDLKKAEAQAREAQIEAALERVRSRSIGMQKSEELKEVIQVVYEQFIQLKINVDHAGFIVDYKPKSDWHFWIADKNEIPSKITHPYFDSVWATQFDEAKEKGLDYFTTHLNFEEKNKFYQDLLSYIPDLPEESRSFYFNCPGLAATTVLNDDVSLYIENFSAIPYKDDENKILIRFGRVFQQTYTRFLDLQKAEAQAREAQIEAALERVRAASMAMHDSKELVSVATVLYRQLLSLGFEKVVSGGFNFPDEKNNLQKCWLAETDSGQLLQDFSILLSGDAVLDERIEYRKKNIPFLEQVLDKNEIRKHLDFLFPPEFDTPEVKAAKDAMPDPTVFVIRYLKEGYMLLISSARLNEEQKSIMERFAGVFNLAYTRFLDLQKAEAQARQALIEASLERVRSKAMAMHNSSDLSGTVSAIFSELKSLGIETIRTGVAIYSEDKPAPVYYASGTSDDDNEIAATGSPHPSKHSCLAKQYNAWATQNNYFPVLTGEELKSYYEAISIEPPSLINGNNSFQREEYGYYLAFPAGNFYAWSLKPYAQDEINILTRFKTIVDLTFKRYFDIEKAEAQARESEIQLALERVRASTAAMHKSDELIEVINTVFQQLQQLHFTIDAASLSMNYKEDPFNYWMAISGHPYPSRITVPYKSISFMTRLIADSKKDVPFFAEVFNKEEKDEWVNHILENTIVKHVPEERKKMMYGAPGLAVSVAIEKNIALTIANYSMKPFEDEENAILKRFANVFEQTYTRFLDLKKAEAQAREAMIETAMEKVRARAMAMQKPDELVEVALVLRKEMGLLGVEELETSSIYIQNETTGKTECWFAIQDQQEKKLVSDYMNMDLDTTWVGREMLAFYYSDKKQTSILMQGEARKEWINYCAKQSGLFGSSGFYGDHIPDRTYHLYKFSNGYMGAASSGEISEESWDLLRRATSVFSLAYTRFSDLQKAEASAREAIKQAVLDRIRADIATMRTVQDLDRITPLIWNELTTLGVPFIRCGVFIMDDEQELIHTFLSTPDGKAIAAFHLSYDTPGNIRKVISSWKANKNYTDHWDENEFKQFADILVKQGTLESGEQYLKTIPHGGFYLHFLPFLQGMLYVGNTEQLDDEKINLIQSVADAFSTAYARYEDFNKLEAAKKQVDSALNDLQQAQKQLIQSEKMASLGELTAGIAHEIQNPLNFVNNFSEVSKELLDEMKEAIEKGDTEDARDIMENVIQNLEKITHHGKRADGIVKGMLQHSRSSSGQKELTDINVLADEYLRLAYHGLRAKDKSFNAKFETHFDESIEKLNIVAQDIGRVVLNLINNAFYAVSEKKTLRQAQDDSYEPTVIVATKKEDAKIFISVKDNGNGIPASVKEKIFQPFFTTKPTGQGTGLGLSLSYDIIKAHGGEFKVETKEGEGSEFIIQLPVKSAT